MTILNIPIHGAIDLASLGALGAKGGAFTILSGGSYRVYGPGGSFIGDNNHFALAMVMTIPLMRFLQMQLKNRWGRHAMTLGMVLSTVAEFQAAMDFGAVELGQQTLGKLDRFIASR